MKNVEIIKILEELEQTIKNLKEQNQKIALLLN